MSKATKPGVLLLLAPGILASFCRPNQSAPAPHESVKREQELPLTLGGFLSDGVEDTGKDVLEILGPAHLSDQEQADAFNAYFEGNDEQDFQRRFRKFNVPDEVMRDLLAKRFPPGYTTVRTVDGRVLHLKNVNLSADEIARSIAAHRALESEKVDGVCGTDVTRNVVNCDIHNGLSGWTITEILLAIEWWPHKDDDKRYFRIRVTIGPLTTASVSVRLGAQLPTDEVLNLGRGRVQTIGRWHWMILGAKGYPAK